MKPITQEWILLALNEVINSKKIALLIFQLDGFYFGFGFWIFGIAGFFGFKYLLLNDVNQVPFGF